MSVRRSIGRRLSGASIIAVLVAMTVLVTGVGLALADTVAMLVEGPIATTSWDPASNDPSGAAYIGPGGYLFVVDTNLNEPDSNGWMYDIDSGVATSRSTGVEEPTGIDYDPDSNTLFISTDNSSGSFIEVVTDFDTAQEQRTQIAEDLGTGDTEDPAFDRNTGILYFVDGTGSTIFRLSPGGDGEFGTGDDLTPVDLDIDFLNPGSDWEGMSWDPRTGNLLLGARFDEEIYEITDAGDHMELVSTVSMPAADFPDEDISGLGVAPASYDPAELSLWITDRTAATISEISFDGTVPPTTTTTTTLATTTTTTSATTTTTSSSTTSTTSPGGSTTTTTTPGGTTTTTIPGGTTTTTVPTDPEPDGKFVDTTGHVFQSAIEWLAGEGITQGCNPPANTRFCPDDRVTRGQMATFLVRAFGYSDNGGGNLFTDDDSSVFENAIDRLATAGVTQGCNPPANTRFCPDELVTRAQMAAFLGRAFDYTDNGGGNFFTDDDGSVFENAIDRLRAAGVTQGCNPPTNTRYCPDSFVTRGQMAAFLKRAFGE